MRDPLAEYVRRPDPAYAWERLDEQRGSEATRIRLRVTSQQWKGLTWRHTLDIYVPTPRAKHDLALLVIGADSIEADYHSTLGMAYASLTGLPCAFLYDVPNQPLFANLREDALIAHTFVQFLDTGSADWPLLLPMTKAACRAMDAVQEAMQAGGSAPARFAVTGMSKRGWAAWLTAAVDTRVVGIIPMVYDNLNLFAQMPHQLLVCDGYSAQISDYTAAGLPARMTTPEGESLARMVDPYTYRERLTMPKLIMIGSNDPYWSTDAVSLYWDELPEPKWLLDVPGAGHSLNDPRRVLGTAAAFLAAVATNTSLPLVNWKYEVRNGGIELVMESDRPCVAAGLWVAEAARLDFRNATWTRTESTHMGTAAFTESAHVEPGRCVATFGEMKFENAGDPPFFLSSPVRTLDRPAC